MISVVILQYQLSNLTKIAVDSIFESYASNDIAEVIIVDNNSAPVEKNWILQDKRLTGIFLDENKRYVGGTNAGWKVAKSDYILLCNNDIALSKSCITRLYECMEKDQQLGWVSACYNSSFWETCSVKLPQYIENQLDNSFGQERVVFNSFVDGLIVDNLYYCDITEATVVMVRKSASDKVGYFCEDIDYHHTHEYSLRLFQAGYKVAVCKNAVFWHHKTHPTISLLKDFNVDQKVAESSKYMDEHYGYAWRQLKR